MICLSCNKLIFKGEITTLTKLIFIEGVSGVGKSTMVQTLTKELTALGYKVKSYLEGDYTNPIDFYHTAYFTKHEFNKLCSEYSCYRELINANTIHLDDIRLIRYSNGKKYIFEEPLLSTLSESEFCYHPKKIIPIDKYISIYTKIWNNFQNSLTNVFDFIIFDGSLLHHPLNDMINNYHITGKQTVPYIVALLNSLELSEKFIFYLKTDNISKQLKIARKKRKQSKPTTRQIEFWESRFKDEMIVLNSIYNKYQILDISDNGWDLAKKEILYTIHYNLKCQ